MELRFIFGLSVTALSLAALHWFPYWRRLHQIGNYVLGVLAIFIGISIWGDTDMIRVWAFPIVAGATVALCYGVDWFLNSLVKARVNAPDEDPTQGTGRD